MAGRDSDKQLCFPLTVTDTVVLITLTFKLPLSYYRIDSPKSIASWPPYAQESEGQAGAATEFGWVGLALAPLSGLSGLG